MVSYTVVYKKMNLDGVTYSTEKEETHEVRLGTTVTPPLYYYEGFITPSSQTVTINSYGPNIITYLYERESYTLTVTDSGNVTGTASGSYLYGTEINLVANATNALGLPFAKWSNDVTDIDYTFTITEDTEIGPVYARAINVTLEPNNGDQQTILSVLEGESVGSYPDVNYDDCVGTTGSYHDRQCTYYYEFMGWFKEPTFVNQVNEDFVPTEDITLYAKWNKVYFAEDGPYIFDGTNYIDTEIQLFSEENADKDFIITFTVNTNNGYNSSTGDRGTIFTDMNEISDPFPGVHFFTQGNTNYTMNVNVLGSKRKDNNTGFITGQSVIIKKVNGYVYYSYDNGPFVLFNNLSTFDQYFDNNATFGAGTNASGNPYRYFKGTLSDMSVEIIDLPSYTIHYDANGGTGMMINQLVGINETVELTANSFTLTDSSFGGWNTEPDGSGTSYTNKASVTGLGNDGDVITLYAQWIPIVYYYVHFDANGGTGTMADQRFAYDSTPAPLNPYSFTRPGYVFREWNTAADGSGTAYQDEAMICDLTDVPNGVVTLYAQYMRVAYSYSGDKVFDGLGNDFIDTGVNLYTQSTLNKDFEIRFTVKVVDSDMFSVSPTQPTMINVKDESNSSYPGFNVRFNGTVNTMTPTYRWGGGSQNLSGISSSHVPIEFVYKRINGVVTLQYSYQGFESQVFTMFNQSSWTLNRDFAFNATFGGIYNSSGNPDRFFKGTLSDMIILVED